MEAFNFRTDNHQICVHASVESTVNDAKIRHFNFTIEMNERTFQLYKL